MVPLHYSNRQEIIFGQGKQPHTILLVWWNNFNWSLNNSVFHLKIGETAFVCHPMRVCLRKGLAKVRFRLKFSMQTPEEELGRCLPVPRGFI